MSNQTNLPEKVIFTGEIDEVTIRKFPGIVISGNNTYVDLYYISFTEIKRKEIEVQAFLFFKKKEIIENRIKHIIPFSFKTFEEAKDFAQYLPNMSIIGCRLYESFENSKKDILYETYKINVDSINTNIYVKFTDDTEHKRNLHKTKEDFAQYYINDLDKHRNPSGEFFEYNKLVVNGFFTKVAFHEDLITMITNGNYKTISDIKEFEENNTHMFHLVEN